MKAVAETLGVSRSNLVERLAGRREAASALSKGARRGGPAAGAPAGRRAADLRLPADHGAPEPRSRRGRARPGQPQARLSADEGPRPAAGEAQRPAARPEPRRQGGHDALRPALVFGRLRVHLLEWRDRPGAFVLDAHDREIIAWRAVANTGISGSDIRDMMLEAVEARFGGIRAPHPVEWLSDNGSIYTARETRVFAAQLNLVPCFTPVASPESNGMSEAFVKTFKRDYLRVSPVPDARTALDQIAGWFDDYNENHPHSGLRMRSPREFRRAHQPAEVSG